MKSCHMYQDVRKGNLTKDEIEEIRPHVIHTENIVDKVPPPPCPPPSRGRVWEGVKNGISYTIKVPFTGDLRKVPFFAAGHHEMLDDSGYPKHVKADNIPIQTRMMTVADIYEALIAKDRPYKKSIDRMKSLAILKEEAKNSRLDNELVRIFIEKRAYETKKDN